MIIYSRPGCHQGLSDNTFNPPVQRAGVFCQNYGILQQVGVMLLLGQDHSAGQIIIGCRTLEFLVLTHLRGNIAVFISQSVHFPEVFGLRFREVSHETRASGRTYLCTPFFVKRPLFFRSSGRFSFVSIKGCAKAKSLNCQVMPLLFYQVRI